MREVSLRQTVKIAALAALVVAVVALVWLRPGGDSAPTASAGSPEHVHVSSFWFCDSSFSFGECETNIGVGETIEWHFHLAGHTTKSNDGVWDSPKILFGASFEFTFNSPGTFQYVCNNHSVQMKGRIVVGGGAPPTLPPPPSPTSTSAPPTPMPTPTETSVPTLPPPPSPPPTGGPTLPPPTGGPTDTPAATDTPPAATDTPPAATDTPPAPTDTAAPPTSTPTLFPTPITPTPAGPVGDASGNGSVDSIDAALILQFSAGLLNFLAGGENADANQNGSIDSIDAALVLQFVAGLLAGLPP